MSTDRTANESPGAVDVHLNLNVRGLLPSATLAINELSNRLRHEGREVYKLGLGQSPFPIPEPVVEELRVNAFHKDYLSVEGLWQLREAVAEYHHRKDNLTCTAEDVLIGPGSKELMFLLQLVYYGNLLIPTPSWVSYAPQAQIIGRQVHWLTTSEDTGWRLTPERLDEICQDDPYRPRIVVLNYPSNPTGRTYDEQCLRALADTARKYRIVLLSDEIYGELHHEGRHISIARFYPEGTIVSSGLSKWCGAGGWRLGTFTFPRTLDWLRKSMAVVASETYTATSAPIQFAAIRAFEGGIEIEHYLSHCRRVLAAMADALVQRLQTACINALPPDGAFYLFLDFSGCRGALHKRGITTSVKLCEDLLNDTGVALLPGLHFGRPKGELTARLAYVDFDGARALAAAEHVPYDRPIDEGFVTEFCGRVIAAVDRICDWGAG